MDYTYKARLESENKIWWETETKKRSLGLENEIDVTEIRNAANGFKNKWSERVRKYPEVFKSIIDWKPCNWQEVIDCEKASS